jgi:hypothetical protein
MYVPAANRTRPSLPTRKIVFRRNRIQSWYTPASGHVSNAGVNVGPVRRFTMSVTQPSYPIELENPYERVVSTEYH